MVNLVTPILETEYLSEWQEQGRERVDAKYRARPQHSAKVHAENGPLIAERCYVVVGARHPEDARLGRGSYPNPVSSLRDGALDGLDVSSPLIMALDISKPIAFCEHLQLSSLGVQPASISFQVSIHVLGLR